MLTSFRDYYHRRNVWAENEAAMRPGVAVASSMLYPDEKLKKMLGGLAYVITGIARLGRIEPVAADLRGPDFAWSGGFLALGLGNGRQAGGGQVLCPDAWINDGQIDLTVLPVLNGDLATVGTLLTRRDSEALERLRGKVAELGGLNEDSAAYLLLVAGMLASNAPDVLTFLMDRVDRQIEEEQ